MERGNATGQADTEQVREGFPKKVKFELSSTMSLVDTHFLSEPMNIQHFSYLPPSRFLLKKKKKKPLSCQSIPFTTVVGPGWAHIPIKASENDIWTLCCIAGK